MTGLKQSIRTASHQNFWPLRHLIVRRRVTSNPKYENQKSRFFLCLEFRFSEQSGGIQPEKVTRKIAGRKVCIINHLFWPCCSESTTYGGRDARVRARAVLFPTTSWFFQIYRLFLTYTFNFSGNSVSQRAKRLAARMGLRKNRGFWLLQTSVLDPVPQLSELSRFGPYRVASALASITADLRAAAS